MRKLVLSSVMYHPIAAFPSNSTDADCYRFFCCVLDLKNFHKKHFEIIIVDKMMQYMYNIKVISVRKNFNYRGIAQLVEQMVPKPRAEGSSPSAPAKSKTVTER